MAKRAPTPGISRRLAWTAVGVLLLAAAALVGCQSQPATPAAPTTAPAAPTQAAQPQPTSPPQAAAATAAPAPQETLKIGRSLPLTGTAARIGLTLSRFLDMSVEDINAKGGIKVGNKSYRLEWVTVDDKNNAEAAREGANKLLLADKVKFIIIPASTPTASAQTITEPNKVMIFASSTLDRSLGPDFPLTFNLGTAPAGVRAPLMVDWFVKDYPNLKRLAIMQTDDAFGKNTGDQMEAAAKAKGLTVVAKEYFPVNIKDFSPIITRVLRQDPEAVYNSAGTYGEQSLALMKALKEQGFKGPTFGLSGDTAGMKKGDAALEGFTAMQLIDPKSSAVNKASRDVIQRAIDKWGEAELEIGSYTNYNLPLVLAQVLEKAGTVDDTEKAAKVFREGEWSTIFEEDFGKVRVVGAKTFGLASMMEHALYFSKVQNGKGVTDRAFKATLP